MLLSKKLNLVVTNSKDIFFLKKNNIENVKIGDSVLIDIEKLPLNSHRLVKVKCDMCGEHKEIKYQSYNRSTENGTCEYYCANSKCIKKKREISVMKKYGVKNVFELEYIKEKIKTTNNNKYGVDNPLQSLIIRDKMKKTNLEKYGVENVFQNELIKNKIIATNQRKYGVSYPQQSAMIRNKYSSLHKSSQVENEVFNFISLNTTEDLKKNAKNVIDGYELDAYIPSMKLAFEFNGLYWHNEVNKEKNYHLKKTKLCEEKDISLFHIYEDQWEYKRIIIESMILHKMNKTYNKIFARKCEIKEIDDNKIVKDFLEKNHLHGYATSKIKIGLYYNQDLVSIMTFGSRRIFMGGKNIKSSFELIRFCSLLNTSVIGGANKMLKYFINKYHPMHIITYADRSWSTGKSYTKMGFNFIKNTEPNYYYVINRRRHYRFKFRKSELVKNGEDISLTEKQIMFQNKIYRIYDSGSKRFEVFFNLQF